MALNKIASKIINDATVDAEAIREEANRRAALGTEKIKATYEAKVRTIQANAAKEAAEIKQREVLKAELTARKNTLSSRRAMLEGVFALAQREMEHLPEEIWRKFIKRIILDAALDEDMELVVPAQDRARYEQGFLTELKQALQQAGKKATLNLSPDDAKFTAGVLLRTPTADVDASFATLLNAIRQQIEKPVENILYEEVG